MIRLESWNIIKNKSWISGDRYYWKLFRNYGEMINQWLSFYHGEVMFFWRRMFFKVEPLPQNCDAFLTNNKKNCFSTSKLRIAFVCWYMCNSVSSPHAFETGIFFFFYGRGFLHYTSVQQRFYNNPSFCGGLGEIPRPMSRIKNLTLNKWWEGLSL